MTAARTTASVARRRDSEVSTTTYYSNITGSTLWALFYVLILLLLGALPTWPHSRSWGYGPSGGLGLIVVILIILLLMGRI